jgi:Fe-S cluster biosynthesis and repair protein YggX
LVEQGTENPRVGGSIPSLATISFRLPLMTRTVFCIRHQQDLEALDFAPLPGDLGKRIFDQVSKQAWGEWLAHQTMLINENRLSPIEPKARAFLRGELEKYFFGDGAALPQDYTPL